MGENPQRGRLSRLSDRVTELSGHTGASFGAFVIVITWALCGPFFGFSEGWQLVINTGTTIITFLMVFLIQHTQNRETRATQLKLDELLVAVNDASERMIAVEEQDEAQLERMAAEYRKKRKDA